MTKTLPSLPPEWARQTRLLIGFPSDGELWEENLEPAQAEVAAFANAVMSGGAEGEANAAAVTLVVYGEAAEKAARELSPDADILNTPMGDTWLRDTGPLFSRVNDRLTARRFQFNGWGEKYLFEPDKDISVRLAADQSAELEEFPFVLEGGSVDWDDNGWLLTTEECLLNPNRNKDWDRETAEAALKAALGVSEIIWISEGLVNDHTDGHIDNLARFVGPGHVVCQSPTGDDDPNADRLRAIAEELRSWRSSDGSALRVSLIPSPGLVADEEGEAMAASHMNFVISNGIVVLPTYNENGEAAAKALTALFPGRTIMARSARAILSGGGAFHCISQQIPA